MQGDKAGASILFLAAEDAAFLRHRLPMAEGARHAGFRVLVAAGDTGRHAEIADRGFTALSWNISRKSLNPLREAAAVADLIGTFRRTAPSVVYAGGIKAIVYGALARVVRPRTTLIAAFTGLGYVFIGSDLKARILRSFIVTVLRVALAAKGTRILVQNADDRAYLNDRLRIGTRARTQIIAGSGVDLRDYSCVSDRQTKTADASAGPHRCVVALYVGRMLWDKGVGELIEAARILERRGCPVRIRLIGAPDPANPQSIEAEKLTRWHDEGLIEWLGPRDDIARQWEDADIAVLPSYREGLPKVLLEAGACARPSVTTDVAGCHDVVRDGVNGLLVPVRDARALADALARLVEDGPLRLRMGREARAIVEARFAAPVIAAQFGDYIKSLI